MEPVVLIGYIREDGTLEITEPLGLGGISKKWKRV